MSKKIHLMFYFVLVWFNCQAFSAERQCFNLEEATSFFQSKVKKESIESRYTLGKVIARGGSSKVHEAFDTILGVVVAVKVINLEETPPEEEGRNEMEKMGLAILLQLDHPNIIKIIDIYEYKNTLYVVTELLEGLELFEFVDTQDQLSEEEVQPIAQQIALIIKYLHDSGVMNRDFKLENFKFRNKGNLPTDLVAFDFGFAILIPRPDDTTPLKNCGTLEYAAPELFQKRYDERVDVWALGCIIYTLALKRMPFKSAAGTRRTKEKIINLDFYQDRVYAQASVELKDILIHIFRPAGERPSISELLRMTWLKEESKKLCNIEESDEEEDDIMKEAA